MNHSKRDLALLAEKATDELLMPKQVAAMFGVCPRTVKHWTVTGKLPAVEITSGHRRYWKSEIERLVAERSRGASPTAKRARNSDFVPSRCV